MMKIRGRYQWHFGTVAGLFFAVNLSSVLPVRAAVLAEYRLDAVVTGQPEAPATTVAAGLTASTLHGTGNLTAIGISDATTKSYLGIDWPENSFGTQALELTLTPNAGFAIDFDSFQYQFSTTFDVTFQVKTSRDNFATVLNGPFFIPAGSTGNETFSLSALPLITGPITFRWFAFEHTDNPSLGFPAAGFSQGGDFPLRFSGTMVAVPEASSFVLLGGAAALLAGRRARLSQRR